MPPNVNSPSSKNIKGTIRKGFLFFLSLLCVQRGARTRDPAPTEPPAPGKFPEWGPPTASPEARTQAPPSPEPTPSSPRALFLTLTLLHPSPERGDSGRPEAEGCSRPSCHLPRPPAPMQSLEEQEPAQGRGPRAFPQGPAPTAVSVRGSGETRGPRTRTRVSGGQWSARGPAAGSSPRAGGQTNSLVAAGARLSSKTKETQILMRDGIGEGGTF